ncbi:hypothetical protein L226DRAFT_527593 [Lentinus tigrinus ALCF2SS1-7]|uniref:uncharacterized protein n=1 Tax=Lentinus tigrinus ALCF2SS1-7 TaxID=1328758 RepID=UPI0011663C87|nr:hypothetical protein L226DRAFT_527593 [Lentinus tigrinus ALCF2SS1-7]
MVSRLSGVPGFGMQGRGIRLEDVGRIASLWPSHPPLPPSSSTQLADTRRHAVSSVEDRFPNNIDSFAWGSSIRDEYGLRDAKLYLLNTLDGAVSMVITGNENGDVLVFDFGKFWNDLTYHRLVRRTTLPLPIVPDASAMTDFKESCHCILPPHLVLARSMPNMEQLMELGVIPQPRILGGFLERADNAYEGSDNNTDINSDDEVATYSEGEPHVDPNSRSVEQLVDDLYDLDIPDFDVVFEAVREGFNEFRGSQLFPSTMDFRGGTRCIIIIRARSWPGRSQMLLSTRSQTLLSAPARKRSPPLAAVAPPPRSHHTYLRVTGVSAMSMPYIGTRASQTEAAPRKHRLACNIFLGIPQFDRRGVSNGITEASCNKEAVANPVVMSSKC